MDPKKTGELIAQTRRERGLTQEQLADRLHLSHTTVSKWERGQGFPEVSLLEPLAKELELTLDELFSGERLPKQVTPAAGGLSGQGTYGPLDDSDFPGELPENPPDSESFSPELASEDRTGRVENRSLLRRIVLCLGVVVIVALIGFAQRYAASPDAVGGDPTRLEGTWCYAPAQKGSTGRRGVPPSLYLDQSFSSYVALTVNTPQITDYPASKSPAFTLAIGPYQVDQGTWEDLGNGQYRLTGALLDATITLELGKTWDKRSKMGYCYLYLPGVEGPLLLVKRGDPGEYAYIPTDPSSPGYDENELHAYQALLVR